MDLFLIYDPSLHILTFEFKKNCRTAYSASKHAAVAFSHGLRLDLASFGIQVTTICPTFHDTPLVTNAFEQIDNHWKSLPEEVVKEYGDGKYIRFFFA